MSHDDGDNPALSGSGVATPADISQEVADITTIAAGLHARVIAVTDIHVQDLGRMIGSVIGKALHWIEMEVCAIKSSPGQTHARCQDVIDTQVQPILSITARYAAVIEKAAAKARKKSPCADVASTSPPPASGEASHAPAAKSTPAPADTGATPLAGIWLPADTAGEAVELSALPAAWWDRANPAGWYVTLTEDAHCQCAAPVLRMGDAECGIVGTLYVATTMELPAGSCDEVLRLLGVPPDMIVQVTQEEKYPADTALSAAAKGEPVAADLLPQLPALPDFAAPINAIVAELRALVELIRATIAQVVAWVRAIRVPTAREICDLLGPVYDAINIPTGWRPGCDAIGQSLQEMMQDLIADPLAASTRHATLPPNGSDA